MIYFVWDSIQILFENQIKCSTMLPPSSQTPSQIITELASDQHSCNRVMTNDESR